MPCHATEGLECVFPIWFTQCGHVLFTLAMPRPSPALTMPFFSRPRHRTAVKRRPVGCLPAFGFFLLSRGVPRRLLSEAFQSSSQRSIPTTVKSGSSTLQKKDLLNCWTSSSDISGYHADFHEGHGTCRSRAGAQHGVCELTNGMGTACYVWIGLNWYHWSQFHSMSSLKHNTFIKYTLRSVLFGACPVPTMGVLVVKQWTSFLPILQYAAECV
jgi:hypothetical protein